MRENSPKLWRNTIRKYQVADHKHVRGRVLVRGGGMASTGAAKLAAMAALRSGAGVSTIACPKSALPAYASALLSVMTEPITPTAEGWERAIEVRKPDALLLGPGNGVDGLEECVLLALKTMLPCVLDADVFTACAEAPEIVWEYTHDKIVFTPHEGEFARLWPMMKGKREDRALEAAVSSGAIIVLKGHDTIIAAPTGERVIDKEGPSWLATAGSGDVLAGLIAGLSAQGMPSFDAACAGVWLHGKAALLHGPGMIAEDLLASIPEVLAEVHAL